MRFKQSTSLLTHAANAICVTAVMHDVLMTGH